MLKEGWVIDQDDTVSGARTGCICVGILLYVSRT
jgi:hypothetical protein